MTRETIIIIACFMAVAATFTICAIVQQINHINGSF